MRTLLFLFLVASPVFAFKSQYVEFDLPEGWKCELTQGTFYCQGTTNTDRFESLVMSIATIATQWDSIDNYEDYLKKPRSFKDETGNEVTSKVTYTRRRNIRGTVWVDSLQYESELPGFWSRYLATVQNRLAILITYIVSDEHYSRLAPQFERMVSSLKTNNDFDLAVASKQGGEGLPGAQKFGKEFLTAHLNTKKKKPDEKGPELPANPGDSKGSTGIYLMVGGAAVLLFLALRKKRVAPRKGG